MMQALQASRFGEPGDVLELANIPEPSPGSGQVQLRPEFVGLNFLDVMLCRGQYPGQVDPPLVPGVECVGRVVAAGPDVDFRAGTRVVACPTLPAGALAERVVVDAALITELPDDVEAEVVAAMPVTYQTAWFALERARQSHGETVLVHAGAGGVGTASIQLAVARGARVIATARGPAKVALCRSLGADVALDTDAGSFATAVAAATDGRGVDIVVDPVGGSVFVESLDCLAFEGRIVPVGNAQGLPASVDPMLLTARNVDVVGLSWGSTYPQRQPARVAAAYRSLFDLLATGAIRPVIDRCVDLGEAPAALEDLARRRTAGKVVVRIPRAIDRNGAPR